MCVCVQYVVEEYSTDSGYKTYHSIFMYALMGTIAITVFALVNQAREYRRAVRAAEEQEFSVSITNKTPLLSMLPYEGAKEIPVIRVSQDSIMDK